VTNRGGLHEAKIVEIIGLAGSGKSTTCRRLRDHFPGVLPTYRVARHRLPIATLRALRWIIEDPTQNALRDPAGGWTGLYLSIHMDAMIRDLLSRRRSPSGMLFLDQGPIFNCISAERLANQGKIHESVPKRMRRLLLENLDFLDAIVVLHADLPILLQRIDERGEGHQIKGAGDDSARVFLEDYQERYDSIVRDIQHHSDAEVLRLDTGRHSPDGIVNEIQSVFALTTSTQAASPGQTAIR
jgi:deoxyadenosine/deoxycytidine kinase